MSAAKNPLIARMKQAWSVFCCQGGPISGEVLMPTLDGQIARRGDIGIADVAPTLGWQCVNRLENCETCPRFKAYRQGVATGKNRTPNLHVPVSANQVETDVGHCDRKAADIEHLNDHQPGAIVILSAGHVYPNPDPVLAPASPSIEETKGRAKQGNAERDCLDKVLVHGASKHSSGSAAGGATC